MVSLSRRSFSEFSFSDIRRTKLRLSRLPSKQMVLYLFNLAPEFRKKYDVCVDVACNDFFNKPFFRFNHYIGTDIEPYDASKLREADENFEFRLGDVTVDPVPSGDLVVCVETIGITSLFDHSQSLDVVRKLISSVNPGGVLVVNIGHLASLEDRHLAQEAVLESFGRVRQFAYGRWTSPVSLPVSIFLSFAMLIFPWLRKPKLEGDVWNLYFASEKLSK